MHQPSGFQRAYLEINSEASARDTMWAGLSEGHTPYCLPFGEAIIELSPKAPLHEISRRGFIVNFEIRPLACSSQRADAYGLR